MNLEVRRLVSPVVFHPAFYITWLACLISFCLYVAAYAQTGIADGMEEATREIVAEPEPAAEVTPVPAAATKRSIPDHVDAEVTVAAVGKDKDIALALIVAIPLVISSLAGAIASIIGAIRGGQVLTKSAAIEANTNGNQARNDALRVSLLARIESLEAKILAEKANSLAATTLAKQVAEDAAIVSSQHSDELQAAMRMKPPGDDEESV